MEVIFGLNNVHLKKPTILTVGTFDGVHLGHQNIIKEMVNYSQKYDLLPTLVTFEPHPKLVVDTVYTVPLQLLSDMEERLTIFKELGLKLVIVIEFTKEFSRMGYHYFLEEILLKKLKAKYIIIGHDHAFGANREGSYKELNDLKNAFNFKLKQVKSIGLNSNIISSSVIRDYIDKGRISIANKMLGRSYSLSGVVVRGEGRGKSLLFPTANIKLDNTKKLIPRIGVYAVNCVIGNKNYRGMANIGYKPTFGSAEKTIEVHIFDFNKNIYNKKIKLFFLKRLRNEKKFRNQQELIKQLEVDKKNSYF